MSNDLNLARKLRPKNFEEIIGQDLSINTLKNSLFLKKLFPVYLFSGQRGCGKTSTARVFGAALNCKNLSNFQADAKAHIVPCLTCESCIAMLEGNHPDFVEMDAASHTGVDSVRQIIESSTYIPLIGAQKLYLIDEAHMLSRAAFNAFLKILEEPPHATTFILATTEIQKIPDTVRSRCFQILFNPVEQNKLVDHLKNICEQEKIEIEPDALKLLTQENDGSVRDTINTLEQVRFSGEKITCNLILKSLGKISETQMLALIEKIMEKNPKGLIEHLNSIQFESLSAKNMWATLAKALRSLLWIKYEVKGSNNNREPYEKVAEKISINRLHALMQILWSQEQIFLKTLQKHLFLETTLVSMCNQVEIGNLLELVNNSSLDTITHLRCSENPSGRAAGSTRNEGEGGKLEKAVRPEKKLPWDSLIKTLEKKTAQNRKPVEKKTSISSPDKWPKAKLLADNFPGKVTQIIDKR